MSLFNDPYGIYAKSIGAGDQGTLAGSVGLTQATNPYSPLTSASPATSSLPALTSQPYNAAINTGPVRTAMEIAGFTANDPFGTNALMGQIGRTNPTVQTSNIANTYNKQNVSPQLEQLMSQFTDQYNTLGQNTQAAYQNAANTYGNLMSSLTNQYGQMGSQQANAAGTSALASGLSPLEAAQQSNLTNQNVMQQYFPQLAQLQNAQANVGIQAQQAAAANQQALALPFLQSVQSPYYSAVAGTKGTQTQQGAQTNPLAGLSLMAQLQQAQQGNQLGYAQLDQAGNQFQQSLAQNKYQFGQGFQNDMAKLLQEQQMQKYGIDVPAQTSLQQTGMQGSNQQILQGMMGANQLANTQLTGNINADAALQNWQRQMQMQYGPNWQAGVGGNISGDLQNIIMGTNTPGYAGATSFGSESYNNSPEYSDIY